MLRDLARIGAKLSPLPPYDFHMGSYQQAWRDPATGLLNASTDPRRAGRAGGLWRRSRGPQSPYGSEL